MSDTEKTKQNPIKSLAKGVTPPYLQVATIAAAKLTGAGAVRVKRFCVAGAAGVREYNKEHANPEKREKTKKD